MLVSDIYIISFLLKLVSLPSKTGALWLLISTLVKVTVQLVVYLPLSSVGWNWWGNKYRETLIKRKSRVFICWINASIKAKMRNYY